MRSLVIALSLVCASALSAAPQQNDVWQSGQDSAAPGGAVPTVSLVPAKTVPAIWRGSTGLWAIGPVTAPLLAQWGTAGDIPLPADYDGDGLTDFAVWRPSTGIWYILPRSLPGTPIGKLWGTAGDVPVRGDFDGDGKTDFVVWRPSDGNWYLNLSSRPDVPVIRLWGIQGDIPVPADYDGDGKTDIAVWRPSNGTWYILPSTNPDVPMVREWGIASDIPVPGDYDGDNKTDMAVWRPSTGTGSSSRAQRPCFRLFSSGAEPLMIYRSRMISMETAELTLRYSGHLWAIGSLFQAALPPHRP